MTRRFIRIDTTKPFELTQELRDLLAKSGYIASLWHAGDAAPELLEALQGLLGQIESLKGESSCIDEDILHGEEYRKACIAASKATDCSPLTPQFMKGTRP